MLFPFQRVNMASWTRRPRQCTRPCTRRTTGRRGCHTATRCHPGITSRSTTSPPPTPPHSHLHRCRYPHLKSTPPYLCLRLISGKVSRSFNWHIAIFRTCGCPCGFLTSFYCDVISALRSDGPFDCDVIMKKSANRCDVGPLAIRQL